MAAEHRGYNCSRLVRHRTDSPRHGECPTWRALSRRFPIVKAINWLPLLSLIPFLTAGILLFRSRRRRQDQIRFIREKLATASPSPSDKRVIAALSTLPDRILNLEPTIRCLLQQSRPPDEIVLQVPEFSRRQRRRYVIPEYLEQLPRVRVIRCETDWGPATKFIPIVQAELAAGRPDALILIVDDDRVYPLDALETYLYYHRGLPDAALTFRGAPM